MVTKVWSIESNGGMVIINKDFVFKGDDLLKVGEPSLIQLHDVDQVSQGAQIEVKLPTPNNPTP